MQASQGLVASENSMMSLWIFVGVMSVIALVGLFIAYKQCKDDAQKQKDLDDAKEATK